MNDKVVDDTSNEEKNKKYLPTSEERRQRNSPQLQNAIVLRIEIALHKS